MFLKGAQKSVESAGNVASISVGLAQSGNKWTRFAGKWQKRVAFRKQADSRE